MIQHNVLTNFWTCVKTQKFNVFYNAKHR